MYGEREVVCNELKNIIELKKSNKEIIFVHERKTTMQKLIDMKNKKGFTLIEMLIVILIVVILLAIAVPAVAAYRRDALRTQDEGAIETIKTAVEATLIRVRPIDTDTGSYDSHTTVNLDYETLVSLSTTHADEDTREFYGELAERLGPNFQGNFKFSYEFATYGGSYGPHMDWVSYWRSDNATTDESVMMFLNALGNSVTDYRTPEYLDVIVAEHPTLGGYYNYNQYRP